MYTFTLSFFPSLYWGMVREGAVPPVLISEAPLEEPLTRAPCFEALRSPSSTDNRTNDDSGSQNGAQMEPQMEPRRASDK